MTYLFRARYLVFCARDLIFCAHDLLFRGKKIQKSNLSFQGHRTIVMWHWIEAELTVSSCFYLKMTFSILFSLHVICEMYMLVPNANANVKGEC